MAKEQPPAQQTANAHPSPKSKPQSKIPEIEASIANQQRLMAQIRKQLAVSESNLSLEVERLGRMGENVRRAARDFRAIRSRCSAFRKRLCAKEKGAVAEVDGGDGGNKNELARIKSKANNGERKAGLKWWKPKERDC
ncbi:predicted protein [Uncinocarpus reesii 1704]|uniref:Uncharacterized protein n=1 Tax=Uncinocarpus reesii (strain UAMH 1704) TaxID=336963 RepID=C4JH90_UNCRE|nr:uncharacterized protein UREG_02663 [Uncinocarpus reesii 1704]EEP77814.1 predicted protein [Uncinocarpus reesii 1704]